MCETYNGWSNRETWAVALHLSNDQSLDEWAWMRIQAGCEEAGEILSPYRAGDLLAELWEEITDPDTFGDPAGYVQNILPMVRDVGSDYRVDWAEVARGYLEDIELPADETGEEEDDA